jgi:two-component system sensor kinase FixL
MTEDSEKYDQIISDYTTTVTHDLNAHLRHIMQYGELLKNEVGPERLGGDGTMYVNALIASTKRLQRLVNGLLSYAQILHIEEEKQNVDLNKLVAEVTADLQDEIKKSAATINIGALPMISVYPLRMKQLLHHLIRNAIKYRSAKDLVVTIGCTDKGTHYLFSVQDNGLGIAEKFQKVIFTPLKRLHSHDKIEGSGLGLAICAAAVKAHNGQIWVESNSGEGSTFFFTIPK